MAVGTLGVTVLNATGLKAMDRNGFSDPYVKVSVAGVTKKTKTMKKTLSPRWDEFMEFPGRLSDLIASPLELRVFDYDTLSRDDPMGAAEISLHELQSR